MNTLLVLNAQYNENLDFKELTKYIDSQANNSLLKITLLVFSDHHLFKLKNILESKGVQFEVLNSANLMNQYSHEFRHEVNTHIQKKGLLWEKYLSKSKIYGFQKFKERIWTYHELSEKNSSGIDVWWLWFHVFIVDKILHNVSIDQVLYMGGKRFKELLSQVTNNHKRDLLSLSVLNEKNLGSNLFILISMRLSILISMIIVTIAAKLVKPFISKYKIKNSINFYTWYPRVWTKRLNNYQDMYYGQLVTKAREEKIQCQYVLRLYDLKRFINPLKLISKIKSAIKNRLILDRFTILESYITFSSLFSAFLNISLLRWSSTFKKSDEFINFCNWNNIDLSPIFNPIYNWASYISLPMMYVLEKAASEVANKTTPKATLLYSFEFNYGRAVVAGTKLRNNNPVMGIQHGPISDMKFMYSGQRDEICHNLNKSNRIIFPDHIFVDGELAKNILTSRGIAGDKITVTGPVRFEQIWPPFMFKRQTSSDENQRMILVAPGLHDTENIARFIADAFNKKKTEKNIKIVIKTHPKVSIKTVNEIKDKLFQKRKDVEIVSGGSIYDLFKRADFFISSYSSTGIEALAYGLPVITLKSHWCPDMSTYYNSPDTFDTVSCAEELKSINWNKAETKSYKDSIEMFFTYNFSKTYRNSTSKTLGVISELIN